MALEGISEREFEKERIEWVRMAWFCSILLAPHNGGKPVDINLLLPEQFQIEKPIVEMTRKEALEILRKIKERLGVKDGN